MEVLLQDLLPGQEYLIQLRSKNQNGTSQWSRAYSFTTNSDVTAPSPASDLSWTVSTTSFIGSWTVPTTDSDGKDLRDFKDFNVTLTASSVDVIFYVTEPRFDLSLSRNISSWGTPQPTVGIKVEVRDTVGNLSTPITSSATNAIPQDVAGFDSTSALGGVNLVWDHVTDNDLKQYEIYVGGSSGFTPGPSNLKIVTTSNSVFYATDILTLQYFKIRAVDAFNQGSANYTLESQVAYPLDGVPDTTAPSQPSAPTISTGYLVAQVSHAMTKQAGGNLEADVDYLEIHASNTTGFTPSSSTLRGTIDSAGQGITVSAAFYFPTTDSMTNLYWKVIAVDRSKNKSSASNQTTGLPGLIENANILNATITDAKVQNLSAAKLIAGTAIINDLFIESNLTVSDAGTIESENFSTGVSGWRIAADGSVEFNDGLFRGDIALTTTISSKQFSVDVGNMDSYFIWEDGNTITGQEPTVLFRGWSFKSDGVGGFTPTRQLQSVVRLTPFGEFQIMFDPSHSSDILSVDGNNQRDAAGDVLERYYGWTDFRMGMGDENETSYANQVEGRDPFANTYYYDTYSTANSIPSMGADTQVSSRINGFAEADGSISQWNPSSRIKLETIVRNYLYSTNIIQDGMDLFDNAGGVSYYNTNTLRNRVTINSVPSNLQMSNSGGWGILYKGLDMTLTSAGSGTHSIAFTSGASTYPITVAAGDQYYMKFHGYRPSALSLQFRLFMKTNTGVTVYPAGSYPLPTFATGVVNTSISANDNYAAAMDNLLIVPSGATSAYFGIEFIGTIATDQVIRIACVQLNKVFNVVGGQKQLVSNFDFRTFTAVGDEYYGRGEATITMECYGDTAEENGSTLVKTTRNAKIKFNVIDRDETPGSLGEEEATMTLYGTGLRLGSYGEPRFPHGEYRTIGSGISVPTNTVYKLLFSNNKTLNTYDGSTMSSVWDDMGIAMDNTAGYTTFVPQRAGLFLFHIHLDWTPVSGTEGYVVELIKDSDGSKFGSHTPNTNTTQTTMTFVAPLSVGEKTYVHVYHLGSTKTYNSNSHVSFVQLI